MRGGVGGRPLLFGLLKCWGRRGGVGGWELLQQLRSCAWCMPREGCVREGRGEGCTRWGDLRRGECVTLVAMTTCVSTV